MRNFVAHQEPTTVEDFVDHIDYAAKLVGIERVGIGSDMDLEGIMGGNFKRVLF